MSKVFYMLSTDEDSGVRNLVVFKPGAGVETADSQSHANFDEILDAVRADEALEDILDLFDTAKAVAKRFEPLTDRISVANGHVYLDGDQVENALSKQIIRFLEEGVGDWYPLVMFFENVLANPEPHSREQLYEWLDRHEFTIDSDGYFLAYKGVVEVDGTYRSIHSGPGIVNGEEVNGQLDNTPGNLVEISRSLVHHDPSVGCSAGLHVGTWEFASTFGSGPTLKVRVNPRDVVSVPTDCNAQKVRVCRYEVIERVDAAVSGAYSPPSLDVEPDDWDYDAEDEYGDECSLCGEPDCGFND